MFELLFHYRGELQLVFGTALCIAMLRWGGGPERGIAVIWLFGVNGLDLLYHAISEATFQFAEVDTAHAIMDAIWTVAFVVVAIYANRLYPLCIAAFQLLAATSHVARELAEAITPIAYAVMAFAPSWGILTTMISGFYLHIKRQRKFGAYRSWRGIPPFFLDQLSPKPASG